MTGSLDSITKSYMELFSNLGMVDTGRFPMQIPHPPPPPPPEQREPAPSASASATADDVWDDSGARELISQAMKFPEHQMMQ